MTGNTVRTNDELRRRILSGVALAATAIATLLVAGTPAHAGDEVLNFRNRATGRCLDSNSDGKVYTLPCNGGSFQKWRLVQQNGPRSYWLANVATGKCLAAQEGHMLVYATGCSGGGMENYWAPTSGYARWATQNAIPVADIIIDRTTLDSNAAGDVYLEAENGGAFQFWDH